MYRECDFPSRDKCASDREHVEGMIKALRESSFHDSYRRFAMELLTDKQRTEAYEKARKYSGIGTDMTADVDHMLAIFDIQKNLVYRKGKSYDQRTGEEYTAALERLNAQFASTRRGEIGTVASGGTVSGHGSLGAGTSDDPSPLTW